MSVVETIYVSSACNQVPGVIDWSRSNLVCYASCNVILIVDPDFGGSKVIRTLCGHSGRINAVKWFYNVLGHEELVSAAADGNVIVWSFDINSESYKPCVLSGHTSNVNTIDAIYDNNNVAIIVSASMDNTIIIWTRQSIKDEFVMKQTLKFDYDICISLKFTFLPKTNLLLLAASMDNSSIQLYLQDESMEIMFKKSLKLSKNEDWVRGMDFTVEETTGDLLLAAASQDHSVVIWRFQSISNQDSNINSSGEPSDSYDKLLSDFITTTQYGRFKVKTDSILYAHEGWVYSAQWQPGTTQLLTASIDKTVIIWEYSTEAKMWLESMRVGEVGGNTLGFYGGIFSPQGNNMLAYSYHGAFHLWNNNDGMWEPDRFVGGHFADVNDLQWSPDGDYILTVSNDMTARIHAPWTFLNEQVTWHEIARPQVHGHCINCVEITGRYKYISGAEEKIFRMFEAPKNFRQNFKQICQVQYDDEEEDVCPKGASVPSLGLSNKAIFTSNNDDAQKTSKKDPYPEESHFTETDLFAPPQEETLIQNTLWPELKKLYGHGYEVFAIAASKDKRFIATSCKSTSAEHAAIIIWDAKSFTIHDKLMSHNLTVVQLEFSPDSKRLLSVSRDRKWSIFENIEDSFKLVSMTDKKMAYHSRIIWCCAWSHDSKYFATGSRDGKAVIWEERPEETEIPYKHKAASEILNLTKESITAICFAPDLVEVHYLLAIGTENGFIRIYRWSKEGWDNTVTMDSTVAHHSTVKRLRFRPCFGRAGEKEKSKDVLQLASCSEDTSVRIYDLLLNFFQV